MCTTPVPGTYRGQRRYGCPGAGITESVSHQQWGEAVSVHCHPGYTHAPSELTEILWSGKIWKGNLHGLRQRSSARPPISKKLKSICQENHIFFPSNRNCTRITLGSKNQICLLHTKSAAAVARTCASRSDWNTLSSSNTTASIL